MNAFINICESPHLCPLTLPALMLMVTKCSFTFFCCKQKKGVTLSVRKERGNRRQGNIC